MTIARYYADFALHHGFAGSKPRSKGVIRIRPISDYVEHATPDTYGTAGRPSKGGSNRNRDIDAVKRVRARAQEAKVLIGKLRDLHLHLRRRIQKRPTAAVRDAFNDVDRILRGGEPTAIGDGKIDVLRSLIRVLSRYA